MEEKKDNGKEEKKQSGNPLLEESKALAERMEKAAADAKVQADRLEQLRSEQLLSGTAGGRPPMPETKPETPKEYADRVMNNKIPAKKND
jgi:hypothetical protein